MKGLKKLALASTIAAVSAGAQAELKALDDASMGELTGQAGLTIDLETKYEIGEFQYKDAGSLYLSGMRMGGHATDGINDGVNNQLSGLGMLDNIRLVIDVAGAGETLDRGLSDFYGSAGLAQTLLDVSGANLSATATGNLTAMSATTLEIATLESAGGPVGNGTIAAIGGQQAAAKGYTDVYAGVSKNRASIEDGDLLIHVTATDYLDYEDGLLDASGNAFGDTIATQAGSWLSTADFGSSHATDEGSIAYAVTHAVDFRFEIDELGIADSGFSAGDSMGVGKGDLHTNGNYSGSTTLLSQIGIQGYLGPVDIHIENEGNGFGDTNNDGVVDAGEEHGRGAADSKIHWDTYYNITDLDVYIDIAGVQISDLSIHNERGDRSGLDGMYSFGFAHSMRDIYAVKDAVVNYDTLNGNTTGDNEEGFVDGIAINTMTKYDLDLDALSFGDTGTSIGGIYLTDVINTTNWTISAH